MSNLVRFPNLGLEFVLNSTAFELFGLEIKWYALIIGTGFLCALIFAWCRGREFGIDFDHFFDPILWGTIAAIIGARLYFVIFHFDLYQDNLLEIFNIRGGGLAIYGAIIGGILAGTLVCRIKKLKPLPLIDMACIGFLIGQAFGRWGNFMNVEAYGAVTSPDYLFGMTSPKIVSELAAGTEVLVHPCFLYESVWCCIGAIGLMIYMKHRRFDGEITLLYLFWYGVERAVVEGLRTDSLFLGNTGIRVSQLLSMILIPVSLGLLIFFYLRTAKRKKTDPAFVPLFRDTEASRALLQETADRVAEEKRRRAERKKARLEKRAKAGEISCETGTVPEKEEKTEPPADGDGSSQNNA